MCESFKTLITMYKIQVLSSLSGCVEPQNTCFLRSGSSRGRRREHLRTKHRPPLSEEFPFAHLKTRAEHHGASFAFQKLRQQRLPRAQVLLQGHKHLEGGHRLARNTAQRPLGRAFVQLHHKSTAAQSARLVFGQTGDVPGHPRQKGGRQ